MRRSHPGEAVAFEGVADIYDATRPHYPVALAELFPPQAGSDVIELMLEAFPAGVIVEPFETRLWVCTTPLLD